MAMHTASELTSGKLLTALLSIYYKKVCSYKGKTMRQLVKVKVEITLPKGEAINTITMQKGKICSV